MSNSTQKALSKFLIQSTKPNSTSTIVCPHLIPLLIHFSFTVLPKCSIAIVTNKLYQIRSSQKQPQTTSPIHSTTLKSPATKISSVQQTTEQEPLKISLMSLLQLQFTSQTLRPSSHNFRPKNIPLYASKRVSFVRTKIRAVSTVPEKDSGSDTDTVLDIDDPNKPPYVGFVFVSSVLLPDGTPDVHFRSACGGQTLRKIMMDSNIELYGPYARALLNCAGGGTCGTCMVEVLEGQELLNPRTDKEKKLLKKKPKNWRLACQTVVGEPDTRGGLVIQQLPEWKGHEWRYTKRGEPSWDSEESL